MNKLFYLAKFVCVRALVRRFSRNKLDCVIIITIIIIFVLWNWFFMIWYFLPSLLLSVSMYVYLPAEIVVRADIQSVLLIAWKNAQ